jgi:hypothetical protein
LLPVNVESLQLALTSALIEYCPHLTLLVTISNLFLNRLIVCLVQSLEFEVVSYLNLTFASSLCVFEVEPAC